MKYLLIFVLFCAAFFGFMIKVDVKEKNDRLPFNKETEDQLVFTKYLGNYQELGWIEEPSEICRSLKFLEGVYDGQYLAYLEFFLPKKPSARLQFNEFVDLYNKLKTLQSMSLFTNEEFKDVVFYSLILGRLSATEEFKNRCWIYDIQRLSEGIILYPSIFPTLQRFTKQQQEFLRLILEGLQFEGVINAFAYNDDHHLFFKENTEYFDLSLLLFICHMAEKFGSLPLSGSI